MFTKRKSKTANFGSYEKQLKTYNNFTLLIYILFVFFKKAKKEKKNKYLKYKNNNTSTVYI